jgi:hypothetical protein
MSGLEDQDKMSEARVGYVALEILSIYAHVLTSLQTLNFKPKSPEELPEWNYDGSSTGQAPGHNSEVILQYVNKPRSLIEFYIYSLSLGQEQSSRIPSVVETTSWLCATRITSLLHLLTYPLFPHSTFFFLTSS